MNSWFVMVLPAAFFTALLVGYGLFRDSYNAFSITYQSLIIVGDTVLLARSKPPISYASAFVLLLILCALGITIFTSAKAYSEKKRKQAEANSYESNQPPESEAS